MKQRESEVNLNENLIKERFRPDFYYERYPKIRMLKLNEQITL